MPTYTAAYSQISMPPSPMVHGVILIDHLYTKARISGDAIVDTGADISCIPHSYVTTHGLTNTDTVKIQEHQSLIDYPVYDLQVGVTGFTVVTERFIDYGDEELIFGRPILNSWRITLDPSRTQFNGFDLEIYS